MYFDIGANVGKWSLANVDKSNKIVAVEASPSTFSKLSGIKNDKIILLNYAVCNNEGRDITFYDSNCDTLSTLNKDWLTSETSRFCGQKYNEIICKTITLDKLIEIYGKPSLIKIDVEGGEYLCLSSLSMKVENLCFEWASETNDITFKCLSYLQGLGFTEFFLQNQDDYSFRPTTYETLEEIKEKLGKTIPKQDWGMLWCR